MSAKKLVVLGGGPGGYIAAFEAAYHAKAANLDLQVTIVERTRLGGTCLNVGCIPTKTILRTAHALADLARLEEFAVFGVDTSTATVDVDALRTRKEDVVDNLVGQIEATAKRLNIEVIYGTGRLASSSPIQLAIESTDGAEYVLDCDALIIATGSVPFQLPALDKPFVWTSDDALALANIPSSIIIVGGGVIGVEFASAYASFGTKVSIVELAKTLIPWTDKRAGKTLAKEFKAQGINLHLGDSLESVVQNDDGTVNVALASGTELSADVVMSAVGRVPNATGFGLQEAGIEFDGRTITVDANYRTNINDVYAIGDVIGGLMLAHEAEHEGAMAAKAVVDELLGVQTASTSNDSDDINIIPGCIYTAPEVATIGLSVADAKQRGITPAAGIAKYAANGKALAEGEPDGYVQIVADTSTGRVLGAQIVGAKAVELITVFIPYLENRAHVNEIAHAVFAHPTLAEVIKLAAEVTASKLSP
ncbi:MAG: dihydrolipoyl dehydrogenase [Coriobacteriia bacterium]|nr:dihydrolipoyl dehydrogenase [Coriobacteriia bacterium]